MSEDSNETIWQHLSQYYQMADSSPLSQALCQLIAEYATDDDELQSIPQLLAKFLSRELKYHHQVQKLHDRKTLTAVELKSVAGKRGIALRDTIENAKNATVETASGEIARQLLLAECYHQIQQPDKVIAHLEKAIEDGAEDPVVYFALGYNRYHLAIESFPAVPQIAEHSSGAELVSFQRACLQAVSAFEKALTGYQSDSEVYEWIGRVLKAAGFEETAGQAFDKADDLAYSDRVDDELAAAYYALAEDPPLAKSRQQMGPITQEEIDDFVQLLEGSHDISELWPGYQGR